MNTSERKQYVLITGASSGLGKAMAEECAGRGMHLVLASLPEEGLEAFGRSLQREYSVDVHCFETDLTQADEPHRLARWVKERFPVYILINNAGVGGSLRVEEVSRFHIDYILNLNIRALAMLTYHFIPDLKEQERAYIMNVASLAGFGPIPYKTVYPASKAFVHAFSHCLQGELKHTSINVTVVSPGTMLTNGNVSRRAKQHGWVKRQFFVTPKKVAKIAIDGMLSGKRTILPGLSCKISYWLMRLVPLRMQLFLLSYIFKNDMRVAPEERQAGLVGAHPIYKGEIPEKVPEEVN